MKVSMIFIAFLHFSMCAKPLFEWFPNLKICQVLGIYKSQRILNEESKKNKVFTKFIIDKEKSKLQHCKIVNL